MSLWYVYKVDEDNMNDCVLPIKEVDLLKLILTEIKLNFHISQTADTWHTRRHYQGWALGRKTANEWRGEHTVICVNSLVILDIIFWFKYDLNWRISYISKGVVTRIAVQRDVADIQLQLRGTLNCRDLLACRIRLAAIQKTQQATKLLELPVHQSWTWLKTLIDFISTYGWMDGWMDEQAQTKTYRNTYSRSLTHHTGLNHQAPSIRTNSHMLPGQVPSLWKPSLYSKPVLLCLV